MKLFSNFLYGGIIISMLVIFLVGGCASKQQRVLESEGSIGEEGMGMEAEDDMLTGDLFEEEEAAEPPLILESIATMEKEMEMKDNEGGNEESDRLAYALEAEERSLTNLTGLESEELLPIYFGFDRCSISEKTKEILQNNAQWLENSATRRIILEGHADERGSAEYNLALGECRSKSVLSYLSDFGVNAKMRTVSFGEEKPVCSEHNEECWSRNRRVEFKIAPD
jgi:peptidoglycan-associated lipoprotein